MAGIASAEDPVQQYPETVEVRAAIDPEFEEQLGSGVVQGPLKTGVVAHFVGSSEIDEAYTVSDHEDVAALDVAMDEPMEVEELENLAKLAEQLETFHEAAIPTGLDQINAVEVFHDEERAFETGLPAVVQPGRDAGMPVAGQQFTFPDTEVSVFRSVAFVNHEPAFVPVPGLEELGIAAVPEEPEMIVARACRRRLDGHGTRSLLFVFSGTV